MTNHWTPQVFNDIFDQVRVFEVRVMIPNKIDLIWFVMIAKTDIKINFIVINRGKRPDG